MTDRPVVIAEAAVPVDAWDDPVRGRIAFTTLLSAGRTPTSGLTVGVAMVEPGGWLGLHRHEPAEAYVVVAGAGVMTIDGDERRVTAGDAVFIPGGVEHGVRNDGDAQLRLHYSLAVDSFEDVEYEWTASTDG